MDDPGQLSEYGKILIMILIGMIMVSFVILLARIIAPKKPNPIKESTYECGEEAIGSSWIQFNPRFYIIALVFLLFDVELIFIFPWATVFGRAEFLEADSRWGLFTLTEMGLFIGILVLGLIYVWKKGDLEWVKPSHSKPKVKVNIPHSAYHELNNTTYKIRDFREVTHSSTEQNDKSSAVTEGAAVVKPAYKPRFKKPGV